ncbi:MAG: cytochrome C [Vicinamibacterales bacterium]
MTRVSRGTLAVCTVVFVTALGIQTHNRNPALAQGGRGGGQGQLPDGPGRTLVQAACVACHNTGQIRGSAGYDKQGWHDLISTMVLLDKEDMDLVTSYLATNFPPRPGREPKLVPGDVQIEIKEWIVPTLGQRPRDPQQLKDGTIWWAGMYASLLGQLNPATGEMREYKLVETARPHSMVADTGGYIWYTGNGNATIGRLDPRTGEVTTFEMPDPAARDPHTLNFDQTGRLWFTLQNSNMLGRLIPSTGEIRLITMPTEDARPYGIQIDSKGVPWVAYNGANKLARIDPETMAVREFATATPETHIRRLALASDDTIYYVDSGRGYLGRFDPRTETFKEWPSPSGPESHPYAIAVVNDVVWYNESNQRPDALVRFDPRTETFQSWAIPSGVGIIRNMRPTPDGNLVIHQSSSNRVGLVLIGGSTSAQSF